MSHSIPGAGGVSSVNGKTGAVALVPADLGAAPLASPAPTGTPTAPWWKRLFGLAQEHPMNLQGLNDPTTNLGTARWAALAVAAYDAVRHGVGLYNGAMLLILAGLPLALKAFGGAEPPCPPTAAA